MHSYETKLCLIQFVSGRRLAIIDPLAIPHEDLACLLDLIDEWAETAPGAGEPSGVTDLTQDGTRPTALEWTRTLAQYRQPIPSLTKTYAAPASVFVSLSI